MNKKVNKQDKGMVDISQKAVTKRVARAAAAIKMQEKAFQILLTTGSPKGDVFSTAKVAGIMAAKATPALIPLCHPLQLNKVNIQFEIDKKDSMIMIISEVTCRGQTGVEMEALTAVSVAALTIYDMMKWAGQEMVIGPVRLLEKRGGQSGSYQHPSLKRKG